MVNFCQLQVCKGDGGTDLVAQSVATAVPAASDDSATVEPEALSLMTL